MFEESLSEEFRLKNIDKARNYLIEELNKNELMSKKHKRVYGSLNYIEYLLTLIYTVTGYVSICTFASLVGIGVGIKSSPIELKICVITAVI